MNNNRNNNGNHINNNTVQRMQYPGQDQKMIRARKRYMDDHPTLVRYFFMQMEKSIAMLKNPAHLIPTILLAGIWGLLSYLAAYLGDPSELPIPLKILSFLTFSQGSMYGNLFYAAGGIVGKAVVAAFLNAMIIGIFEKKKPFENAASGLKEFAKTAAIKGVGDASPLIGGAGFGLFMYGIMNGRQSLEEAMVGIVAMLMALKNLGEQGGFLTGLVFSAANTFSKGRTPSRLSVERVLTGASMGFAMGVALSVLPLRPCIWIGLILLIIAFIIKPRRNSKAAAASMIIIFSMLLPFVSVREAYAKTSYSSLSDYLGMYVVKCKYRPLSEYRDYDPEFKYHSYYGSNRTEEYQGVTGISFALLFEKDGELYFWVWRAIFSEDQGLTQENYDYVRNRIINDMGDGTYEGFVEEMAGDGENAEDIWNNRFNDPFAESVETYPDEKNKTIKTVRRSKLDSDGYIESEIWFGDFSLDGNGKPVLKGYCETDWDGEGNHYIYPNGSFDIEGEFVAGPEKSDSGNLLGGLIPDFGGSGNTGDSVEPGETGKVLPEDSVPDEDGYEYDREYENDYEYDNEDGGGNPGSGGILGIPGLDDGRVMEDEDYVYVMDDNDQWVAFDKHVGTTASGVRAIGGAVAAVLFGIGGSAAGGGLAGGAGAAAGGPGGGFGEGTGGTQGQPQNSGGPSGSKLPSGMNMNSEGDITWKSPSGETIKYYDTGEVNPETGEKIYRDDSWTPKSISDVVERFDYEKRNAGYVAQNEAVTMQNREYIRADQQANLERERLAGKTDAQIEIEKIQRENDHDLKMSLKYGSRWDNDPEGLRRELKQEMIRNEVNSLEAQQKAIWMDFAMQTSEQVSAVADVTIDILGDVTGPAGKTIKKVYNFAKPGLTTLATSVAEGKDGLDVFKDVTLTVSESMLNYAQGNSDGKQKAILSFATPALLNAAKAYTTEGKDGYDVAQEATLGMTEGAFSYLKENTSGVAQFLTAISTDTVKGGLNAYCNGEDVREAFTRNLTESTLSNTAGVAYDYLSDKTFNAIGAKLTADKTRQVGAIIDHQGKGGLNPKAHMANDPRSINYLQKKNNRMIKVAKNRLQEIENIKKWNGAAKSLTKTIYDQTIGEQINENIKDIGDIAVADRQTHNNNLYHVGQELGKQIRRNERR